MLSEQQLSNFTEICRAHGLKVTQQRLEVYQALVDSSEHPSAETLHRMLHKRMPTLSLDTVYRTLATFEDLGLVKRVETVTSQARFEAKKEPHHHFFCDQCGQLIDFPWQCFDQMSLPRELDELGRVRERSVVLHGTCVQCLSKK